MRFKLLAVLLAAWGAAAQPIPGPGGGGAGGTKVVVTPVAGNPSAACVGPTASVINYAFNTVATSLWLCSATNVWVRIWDSATPQTTVLIQEQVLSVAATTFAFTSIPQVYRDLIVRCVGRGDVAATAMTPAIILNGDSGADYDQSAFYATDGSLTSYANVANAGGALAGTTGVFPGGNAPANYASGIEILFQNYVGTTFYKMAAWKGGLMTGQSTGGLFQISGAFWWRSTSAISSISVAAGSGNFVVGSRCSLYGSL